MQTRDIFLQKSIRIARRVFMHAARLVASLGILSRLREVEYTAQGSKPWERNRWSFVDLFPKRSKQKRRWTTKKPKETNFQDEKFGSWATHGYPTAGLIRGTIKEILQKQQ